MNATANTTDTAIEHGSDNPYADLAYPDAGAMLVKARLAHEIGQIIKSRRLSQSRAAELLDMPAAELFDMLNGKFRDINQSRMIDYLNRLGRDVDIVVKKSRHRAPGHTMVVLA